MVHTIATLSKQIFMWSLKNKGSLPCLNNFYLDLLSKQNFFFFQETFNQIRNCNKRWKTRGKVYLVRLRNFSSGKQKKYEECEPVSNLCKLSHRILLNIPIHHYYIVTLILNNNLYYSAHLMPQTKKLYTSSYTQPWRQKINIEFTATKNDPATRKIL